MQKYADNIISSGGRPLVGATIRVTNYPAGTLATIYSDNGSTLVSNPLTSDSLGYFEFYAADGRYILTITSTTTDPVVRTDVLLEDPIDGISAMAAPAGSSLVGFSAASGTPRTAQDKLREVVSIKDFGAVGDGVADDTAAIQAALDHVLARPQGCAVYAPAGRYRLTAPLNLAMAKHITMYGDGQATQFFGASAFGFLLQITVSNNAAYGSVFRNFMLAPAASGYTSGISATAANGFTFDGVTVQGQAVGMQFASSYAVRINCKFDVTTSEGVKWTTSAHGANLRGSKFYTCGVTNSKPAVSFDVASNNVILDDCVFEYSYKAASFQDCTSIRMNGCYVEYCAANDVDFLGACTGVSMDDGWFYAGTPTFTIANVNGMSFKRNTVGNKTVALGTGTANIDTDKNALIAGGAVNLNYWAEQVAGPGGIPFIMPDGPDTNIQARISSKGAGDVTFYTGSQGVLGAVVQHVPSAVTYARFEPGTTGDMPTIRGVGEANTGLRLSASGAGLILSASAHRFNANVGFYGTTPIAKPTITGSRGGNVALASLITALAAVGLVTDSTTA